MPIERMTKNNLGMCSQVVTRCKNGCAAGSRSFVGKRRASVIHRTSCFFKADCEKLAGGKTQAIGYRPSGGDWREARFR